MEEEEEENGYSSGPAAHHFISEGRIMGIKLGVASDDEIVKAQPLNDRLPWKKKGEEEKPLPVGKLTHPSQLLGNASLGLPLQFGGCDSCGATNIKECEGHFGFIELPMPIYHPSHVAELRKMLNMICFSCLQFKTCKVARHQRFHSSRCLYVGSSEGPPTDFSFLKEGKEAYTLKLRQLWS